MKNLKKWMALGLLSAVAGMWVAGAAGQEGVRTQTLRFHAEAGVEYEIQWSASLEEWSVLERWTADAAGEAAVEVSAPENAAQSFFRIARVGDGQEVVSACAIGQTVFALPAGEAAVVAIPYWNPESADGTYRFGETEIARGLPVGSCVFFWDRDQQTWGGGMKSAFGWDPAESNRVLQVGEGFCVQNGGEEAVEVAASGEVPSEPTLVRAYAGDNGWSAMAHPYPVEAIFGDTDLAVQLPSASSVAFWNSEAQAWLVNSKSARGWSGGAANFVLGAGDAFFIRSPSEGSWAPVKPYLWP